MNNDNSNEKDKYINLSNIAALVSFSLITLVIFSLLRYHLYFEVLLHVPIFQLIDTSELLLMAAPTAITLVVFAGSIQLVNFIVIEKDFKILQKIIFSIFILSLGLLYFWLNYSNNPIFKIYITYPFKYWYAVPPIVIISVLAFNYNTTFFKKNKFIAPLLLALWYALFEGWANYEVVTKSKYTNNISVQTKSYGLIKTDSNIINAGRTKSYWFYYNRQTHITKVIKTDDIEFSDFEDKNK